MGNFNDTFETRKRSFVSPFSICMIIPLRNFKVKLSITNHNNENYRKIFIVFANFSK